ncbi:MAG: hypothetical protein R2688_08310 [Fimbriimonadaceae bacterium]
MWLSLAGMRQNDGAVEAPPPIRDDVRKMLTDRTKVMVNFYINLITALWAPIVIWLAYRVGFVPQDFLSIFTLVGILIILKHGFTAKYIWEARNNLDSIDNGTTPLTLLEPTSQIKLINRIVFSRQILIPYLDYELRDVRTASGKPNESS